MSILIKKMEMPKGCWACPFAIGKHYECLFTKKSTNWGLTTRPSDCPLVEVQPHGRLKDAEVLKLALRKTMGACVDEDGTLLYSDHLIVDADYDEVCNVIDEQPTIQPEQHWIPVTKKLPEPRIDVWCNSDLGQIVGYYDETIKTWFGRDYLELFVNAWMPLPQPYKWKE